MELLIVILLILIAISQALICWVIICVEKWLATLCSLDTPQEEEAKVTDPYTKPAEVFSSTSHIVVPKTPTEIRNQNFKRLKEGVEYGDFDKR